MTTGSPGRTILTASDLQKIHQSRDCGYSSEYSLEFEIFSGVQHVYLYSENLSKKELMEKRSLTHEMSGPE